MRVVTNELSRPLTIPLGFLGDVVASFRWALAARNECARWEADGHRLDGTAIRRIVSDIDADLGRGGDVPKPWTQR